MKFLVINLGSTSTKIAVFEDGVPISEKEVGHDTELIRSFMYPKDQFEMRLRAVEDYIEEAGLDMSAITAIVSRGGNVVAVKPGAYVINETMLHLLEDEINPHISNTSPRVAYTVAQKYGLKSYIYDAVSSDELQDVARFSGMPFLPRISVGHPLNQRAVAIRYAESIGRAYQSMDLIVVHMGGGCSVGLHEKGHIVDIICDDEGGFSPERCGGVFCGMLLEDLHRGNHSFHELRRMWRGEGGLVAYLGTNSVIEVEERIRRGDEYAALVFDAMVYQTAKVVGCMAGAHGGPVDAVILTGGVARSRRWTELLSKKVSFLAPVAVIPGAFEMEALARGVQRALEGREEIHAL